jgi:DNA mismatch repair ATPase MutS
MGGKSVALKSVAMAVAMAQLGLLVPAKGMVFSMRDFVYYSQQDEDPGQGLSTFGAEIQSLSTVLPRRDERGLYLLDEPARGTNPWEGGAIIKALLTWLGQGNSLTLAATHFPGLSDLAGIAHLQVAGLVGARREDMLNLKIGGIRSLQKLMDYSLIPGKGDIPRDALKVAAFLGLAPEIIESASRELGLLPWEV